MTKFEAANIIRRHDLAGLVSADRAALAHADLLDLAIEHWPYVLLAPRAWQLRQNLSIYDAGYVALAELTDATLVTLDRRISSAPGLRCTMPPLTRRIRDRSRGVATPPGTRRAQW